MIATLLLLNNGEYLISLVEQLELEPSCHLNSPYRVTGMVPFELTPWPNYTDEKDILLHSSTIQTMCEPNESLFEQYLIKIGKTREEVKTITQQLLLENKEPEDYGDRDFPVDDNNYPIYEDGEVLYIEE